MNVMVPVNEQSSGNQTCSEQGKHNGKPLPKAGVVIRKSLELRVQVESQECPHKERLGSVAAGKGLHRQELRVFL